MRKIKLSVLAIVISFVLSGCSISNLSSNSKGLGSIWKSVDGGKTWEVKNKIDEKTSIPQVDVLNIAINRNDPKNVYIGTQNGILLATTNGGDTWKKLNFTSTKIYGLDIDPLDGKIVYASGLWNKRGKIFKSLDGGENWKEVFTTPAEGPLVVSLIVNKQNSKELYASISDGQIIKSQDAGESWKNIYTDRSPITKISLDAKNDKLIYAVTLAGEIFRSKDAGQTFEDISKNTKDILKSKLDFSNVETDPQNENWVYASGVFGMIVSKDGGEKWQAILSIMNNSKDFPIKTIAINPLNSKEISYGASMAVYKSVDEGNSWMTSQFESGKTIKVLKYDPVDPNTLYVGFSN